jgi:hypothetical protein
MAKLFSVCLFALLTGCGVAEGVASGLNGSGVLRLSRVGPELDRTTRRLDEGLVLRLGFTSATSTRSGNRFNPNKLLSTRTRASSATTR